MKADRDEFWMRRALKLAARGLGTTRPNPPVGAVVVRGGRAVGEGYHRRAGRPHAEIVALRGAGGRALGATLYVTLEPCSSQGRTGPCTAAIVAAGIARVVAAVRDPNPAHRGRGLRRLRRRGLRVSEGVGGTEANELIRPFAKWIATGRPYVTLKMGMTLDGRIADAAGRSRWITSDASRRRVRSWRQNADAILIGVGTALRDNPSLLPSQRFRHLHRIVVDSGGRLPLAARLLNDGRVHQTVVATTRRCRRTRRREYEARGARVWVLPGQQGRVSLSALLRRLGKLGLLHVLCEGGSELAQALVRRNLVDEYCLFVAPRLLGGNAKAVVGGGWALPATPWLTYTGCERLGRDLLLRAVPAGPCGTAAVPGRSTLTGRAHVHRAD